MGSRHPDDITRPRMELGAMWWGYCVGCRGQYLLSVRNATRLPQSPCYASECSRTAGTKTTTENKLANLCYLLSNQSIIEA